jgi:hypothetical protein
MVNSMALSIALIRTYVLSNGRMISKLRIRRKRSWPNLRYYSDICLEWLREVTVKMYCLKDEISTQDIRIRSMNANHLTANNETDNLRAPPSFNSVVKYF